MKLVPYLNFMGNCEEALNHYKKVLGGTITVSSRYDDPNMNAPENYKDKILHAELTFDGGSLMGSDTFPGQELKYGDSMNMSLGLAGEEEATRVFNALAEGGKVLMPLEKQFWGDMFGHCIDRFGTRWMINATV
jgi:PhnB protein